MKILIIYDSVFGNTEKVAVAICNALKSANSVELCHINSATNEKLNGIDLLIVGSPTRGFRPTKPITDFLNMLTINSLQNTKVAAFDTRIDLKTIKFFAFRFLVDKAGYAAKSIANILEKAGGKLITSPEGFVVSGEEGPLKIGELERAANWIRI